MTGIWDQAERVMLAILWIVLTYPFSFFRPRQDLALEVLALRHQLMVLKRQPGRPKLGRSDRYRLIACREFKRLDYEQAQRLAVAKGISLPKQTDYTLAEIYCHAVIGGSPTTKSPLGFAA